MHAQTNSKIYVNHPKLRLHASDFYNFIMTVSIGIISYNLRGKWEFFILYIYIYIILFFEINMWEIIF